MAESTLIKNIKKFDGFSSVEISNELDAKLDSRRRDGRASDVGRRRFSRWQKLDCMLICTPAKQMWDNLVRIHEQKSVSNKMLLLQKFHGYRMESNESVVHLSRVQNMSSQLKDLGEAISDTTIMVKVLCSLPIKYNVLQTAWDSVSEERQTLDNLLERLLKEERRLEGDDDITRALAAFSLGGNKKKIAANQNKNMKENRENRNKSVECVYCRRKGHLARDCRKKKRDTDNANENPLPNSEVVERLIAVDTSDVWITDSGASRHITYRRDWYSEFESSSGESISLGDNGVCEVTGSGTVLIDRLVNGKWCKARIENVLYVPKIRKNLFSVGVCTDKGFDVLFKGKLVTINCDGEAFGVGVQQDNQIYRMLFKVRKPSVAREAYMSTVNLRVWHERMGHGGTHDT
ncbi:unnamed protein product [Hermetia illucens]|uniref:CCHC-type domain-containing protein n=1 Tax=Hermetia illucens TaxID=343691 RepID=A0A7R8YZG1_HERIL|nr:unnamed protein product [Hermetia illucens]